MSYQSSSEEQLDGLKDFLRKYGKLLALIVLLAIAIVFGWRYWQQNQEAKTVQASEKFEQLADQLEHDQPQALDKMIAFAKESDTIYGAFAALKVAQYYVDHDQDYAQAKQILQVAADKAKDETTQAMVNVRLARLQYQQGQYEQSLQTLANINDAEWQIAVNDVRGDVLTKLQRYPEALNAYQKALSANPTDSQKSAIAMKLNELQFLIKQSAANTEPAAKSEDTVTQPDTTKTPAK